MTSVTNHQISISLLEPRIPQNTGNIARTCAAFHYSLHLIKPLGYSLEDKYLKRAGLDYWSYVDLIIHDNYNQYIKTLNQRRVFGFSKDGGQMLSEIEFRPNDVLLFGREDRGLPPSVKSQCSSIVTIPMPGRADINGKNGVRSLNLSSACAIAAYSVYVSLNTGK